METILEQQRRLHEEYERLEDAMVKEMLHKKNSTKEQINSDHRVKVLFDRKMECSALLKELYEDKDSQRKDEIQALSGPNEFHEFYTRLVALKDFHRKHPNEVSVPMSVEFDQLEEARKNPNDDAYNMADFSGEEGYGKFLDLHEPYTRYINLKGIEKMDYISYLRTFDRLFEMPKERKMTAEYKKYLETLLDYLQDYMQRVEPLRDLPSDMQAVNRDFQLQWENNTFVGWPKEAASALTHGGAHLDLSAFSSPEELASLGLDRLKSALMALGLKCGGTLEERAQRLFSTKGKSVEELDPAMFTKSKAGKGWKKDSAGRNRELGTLEAQIYWFTEQLGAQRKATLENVQRKQARTDTEREEEEEETYSDSESEEEEDDTIYNPKNLPLGWDGKPIPYWLYKLHGLNIYYNCEICGNYKYRGPKAFQRHFAEWRHAHGMRCLGIPNTAHFANVTLIEDAIGLWNKLKTSKEVERWKAEVEEEFEDSSGNVVSKKIFEDLKRQGLL